VIGWTARRLTVTEVGTLLSFVNRRVVVLVVAVCAAVGGGFASTPAMLGIVLACLASVWAVWIPRMVCVFSVPVRRVMPEPAELSRGWLWRSSFFVRWLLYLVLGVVWFGLLFFQVPVFGLMLLVGAVGATTWHIKLADALTVIHEDAHVSRVDAMDRFVLMIAPAVLSVPFGLLVFVSIGFGVDLSKWMGRG
jgi:hypothetical protein